MRLALNNSQKERPKNYRKAFSENSGVPHFLVSVSADIKLDNLAWRVWKEFQHERDSSVISDVIVTCVYGRDRIRKIVESVCFNF